MNPLRLALAMAGPFDGKIAIVAGVGPGVGTAVACLLAHGGATVVAVARSATALDPLAIHARARGWSLETRSLDSSDVGSVDALVRSVVDEHQRLDALALNVGRWVPGEGLLHRMSKEEWDGAVDGNLAAIYAVGHAALPSMVAQRSGSVVLVAAAPAVRLAGSAAYAAAKAGVVELAFKLGHDYRALGVRVNAVLPGSMGHDLGSLDPPAASGPIPLADTTRTSPWEVARAIAFLLSDESRWITGTTVTIDGGESTGGAPPG